MGGGGSRDGEDHPLSLEVSEEVQDGVQLLTERIQLSPLVLSLMPPARLAGLPRSTNHLPGQMWTGPEVGVVQTSLWFYLYLLELLLPALVSELHADHLPFQAAQELHLWSLSICGLLQLPEEPAQLKEETSKLRKQPFNRRKAWSRAQSCTCCCRTSSLLLDKSSSSLVACSSNSCSFRTFRVTWKRPAETPGLLGDRGLLGPGPVPAGSGVCWSTVQPEKRLAAAPQRTPAS